VLAGEHALKLERGDVLVEALEVVPDLPGRVLVVLFAGELVEQLGLVEAGLRRVEQLDELLDRRLLSEDDLRTIAIVPKRRVGDLSVELL